MVPIFLPGLWAAPQIVAALVPASESARSVQLDDHALDQTDAGMPVLVAQAGAMVDGMLVEISEAAFQHLTAVQAVFDAYPAQTALGDSNPQTKAHVFLGTPQHALRQDFAMSDRRAEILAAACAELLSLAQTHPPAALKARWPMALSHAASVQRGRSDPAPASLRRDWSRADVKLVTPRQPYAWYFGVREDDLQFRRFDGQMSEEVKRAGFVMSDAVTVLPYDPRRDRVMVVEQFRYGPWLRGAPNPWSLEPIAGRVDPFETPQEAVLREAREETGLVLAADKLLPVGNVYPSPGAITEFLFQFVALCDLPDGSEGVSGLEGEAEDIRSHVISFARLIEIVTTGEAQNGPLVLTAWWLAAHRAELQATQ
ncbi:MAG: NUDIX domain-containing protein [Roseinatronobacter sp.]